MRIDSIEPKLFSGVVADEFAVLMSDAVDERGVCTVALSGGSTPAQVYRALSLPPRVSEIPWRKVKFFWGDERWVPENDNRSNYHMVHETFLSHLRTEKPKVFKVNTTAPSPEDGAKQYHDLIDREVQKVNGVPCFDVMILGIGEDGHTASIFPGSPLPSDPKKWVFSVPHPTDNTIRVSMSPKVITSARNIIFMATGASKADIIHQVIEGSAPVEQYPARLFVEAEDRVIWFLDTEAAAKLTQHPT